MTVAELIAELQAMPQDAVVCAPGEEYEYHLRTVDHITLLPAAHQRDWRIYDPGTAEQAAEWRALSKLKDLSLDQTTIIAVAIY